MRPVATDPSPRARSRARWIGALCGLALVLAACLPEPPAQGSARLAYERDFPDPSFTKVGETHYGFATSGNLRRIQVVTTTDFVDFTNTEALEATPAWAHTYDTWAPAMTAIAGRYALYYTAQHRAQGVPCLSVAFADDPAGPYVDESAGPLVCQRGRGGSIDPRPVHVGGKPYLLWKSEGVRDREPTKLWAQRLRDDGRSVAGVRRVLLETTQDWEGDVIENPAMTWGDGRLWLFYSANRWASRDYAVGVAECDTPTGPCRRVYSGPVVASRPGMAGPGGADIVKIDGSPNLVFHAWPDEVGYGYGGRRALFVAPVSFGSAGPRVG